MDTPLILVIDDSPTIRKLVECHLTRAGQRVALAADAETGIAQAISLRPNLILLDHQLPGTTGDEVCRKLLDQPETAEIPVVVSSTLRNRAFMRYADYPNVVDQIPKPFTPELLLSGVANALATGAMVVKAQRTGSAVPEAVGEVHDPALEGNAREFPVRSVIDFLNNLQLSGRLTVEIERERVRVHVASGRIQAVVSPTIEPQAIEAYLPNELGDLAPLLALTLREQQDASMAGLVRLLERSLSDPRRLRSLLKFQAGVLIHRILAGTASKFAFEPGGALPPMFQAFPLQLSLAALALAGTRRVLPETAIDPTLVVARVNQRGGNLDRTGLTPTEMKLHTLFDGSSDLAAIAERAGVPAAEVFSVIQGLELLGMVERRGEAAKTSLLVFDEDSGTTQTVQRVLGPEGEGYRVQAVREPVALQFLSRRNRFDVILVAADRPEHEALFHSVRKQSDPSTRFLGIAAIEDESAVSRLDSMGFDGVLSRPIADNDLRVTVKHLLGQHAPGQPVLNSAH